jgi:hypothetical protein
MAAKARNLKNRVAGAPRWPRKRGCRLSTPQDSDFPSQYTVFGAEDNVVLCHPYPLLAGP